jgi:hypothetical protein
MRVKQIESSHICENKGGTAKKDISSLHYTSAGAFLIYMKGKVQ